MSRTTIITIIKVGIQKGRGISFWRAPHPPAPSPKKRGEPDDA
ncbi:hypothetical protein SAMN04515668_0504 [Hymenobacter arizonensis]|uniref:Uncharacterized protein n=1 Tax=Hymenobacter arizonensis TaxID=1227077 RepID=A0A1I5TJU7_HYMAR|nr:hypothetical protein SAMN04515668_0504 [Hymenobacter arizonensis]